MLSIIIIIIIITRGGAGILAWGGATWKSKKHIGLEVPEKKVVSLWKSKKYIDNLLLIPPYMLGAGNV